MTESTDIYDSIPLYSTGILAYLKLFTVHTPKAVRSNPIIYTYFIILPRYSFIAVQAIYLATKPSPMIQRNTYKSFTIMRKLSKNNITCGQLDTPIFGIV